VFTEALQRMMVVVVTTGAVAVSCAKLQSYHHHQRTNTQYNNVLMEMLNPIHSLPQCFDAVDCVVWRASGL